LQRHYSPPAAPPHTHIPSHLIAVDIDDRVVDLDLGSHDATARARERSSSERDEGSERRRPPETEGAEEKWRARLLL